MKKLATLPAIAAAMIFIGIGSISMNTDTPVPGDPHSIHTAGTSFFTDTVPPKPVKVPAIKVPKFPKPPKPPNLLKMIGEVFKFKKRANQREKARVIEIINELSITDSINASAEITRLMIDKLSDTLNQNFDSLLMLIRDIKEYQLGDSARQMDFQNKYREFTEFKNAGIDKYSTAVTEKELNILASKIFPIISLKTEVTDLQAKIDRIRMLERIRDSTGIIRNVGNRLFTVNARNDRGIYGFYTFEKGRDNNRYKFNYLNTLVYGNIIINSQTGDMRYLNGVDTSSIIDRAQKAGCEIALTFSMEGERGLNDFLHNDASQETFITSALSLVKFRNAGAINISLGVISYNMAPNFTLLIRKLSDRIKKTNSSIRLLLTVPAIISGNNYELAELNDLCNGFIADFSRNYSSKPAPLASADNINEVYATFIQQKVGAEKIIACLPYRGTKWIINNGFGDKFLEYISYKTIRSNYPFSAYTDYIDSNGNAMMDSLNVARVPIRRIFYDDESTFAAKFELIKKIKAGGVAVYNLNDNANYPGLWDELSYAFASPDTVFMPGDSFVVRQPEELGFFERWSQRFALYNYILQNPCEICFENNTNQEQRERFNQYMVNLKIDSLMLKENERLMKDHEDTFRSRFEFVNWQLTKLLRAVSIVIFILLLGLAIFYYLKLKYNGSTWKWKKVTGRSLIVVINLFVLFFFTWMFSSNTIPYFGTSVSANSGYSKDYGNYANSIAGETKKDEIMNMGYCSINSNSTDCINMPLHTLLGVVVIGLLIGFLITRYLIMPLLKRQDIP